MRLKFQSLSLDVALSTELDMNVKACLFSMLMNYEPEADNNIVFSLATFILFSLFDAILAFHTFFIRIFRMNITYITLTVK